MSVFSKLKNLLYVTSNLLNTPPPRIDITTANYIHMIESGQWKDRYVFGISEKDRGYIVRDPEKTPGSLMFGMMGSGKSKGLKFTVYTHYACNSENTLYVIFDAQKSATDYMSIFPVRDGKPTITNDNVVTALGDVEKFIPMVDLLYSEAVARKVAFERAGVSNYYEWDQKKRKFDPNYKGIARICVIFEEFWVVPNHKKISFFKNEDDIESPAGQMKALMRISRSLGFSFNIATQKAVADDVPSSIKPGLANMFGFRTLSGADAAVAGLEGCDRIGSDQSGRAVYEYGQTQFPYVQDDFADELIAKYKKPFKGELLSIDVPQFHQALSGSGAEKMAWIKPYAVLTRNHETFDRKEIVKRYLEFYGFEHKAQPNKSFVADLLATRDGVSYAVVIASPDEGGGGGRYSSRSSSLGVTAVRMLKESMKQLGAEKILGFDFDGRDDALSELVDTYGGIMMDKDGLTYAATIMDTEKTLTKEDADSRYMTIPLHPTFVSTTDSGLSDGKEKPDSRQTAMRGRKYNL